MFRSLAFRWRCLWPLTDQLELKIGQTSAKVSQKHNANKIMTNLALLVAILMGFGIAFQPVTNAVAARYIGLAPLMVVSNSLVLLGSIVYALWIRERVGWDAISSLRPDLLFGGALYGLMILFGGIYVFPKLGATVALMVIIMSQLVFGLMIDHYGLYGIPRQSMSWGRALGILFIIMGILLVRYKKLSA